ncbi:MAG TPA: hypothetical protein VGI63_00280 [Verrucomicrobiae bacterium]
MIRPFRFAPGLTLAALWFFSPAAAFADSAASTKLAAPPNLAEPKILTGTLYELGSQRKKVLFLFKRTAVCTNGIIRVEREFSNPGGSVAALENAVYESNRLVSFQMKEFQANVSGNIEIAADPKNPAKQKLYVGYARGLNPPPGAAQALPDDTVVDDTVYPFLLAHWDDLMRGEKVKFHFVSLEWERTFMFRFVKVGETMLDGKTVEQIKMEPANLLVARLVDPLVFNVEKDSPHHLISYLGRTTPRVKKGKAWKYLDAETVFDWK